MIGLFGGTFDPVHEGHLWLAKTALAHHRFKCLYLVPAKQNPIKSEPSLASAKDRLAMVQLAVAEERDPRLKVLDWEVLSPKPSYTVHTVEKMQESEPDVALIMGNEVFANLPSWHDSARLAELVSFIVVGRDPRGLGDPTQVLKTLGIADAVVTRPGRVTYARGTRWVDLISAEPPPFSATRLRAELAHASSAPQGIRRSVWQYIKEKRLYTVMKKEA